MTIQTHATGSALAIRDDQASFTPQQVAALKQLGVQDASEGDLQVFFHQSQRTGLDPFARQIYMIGRVQNENINGRWEKVTKQTIQTGIDGFRLVARRASDAARESFGYEDTLWCDNSGRWYDVWLSETPPAAAKVTVIRNGSRFPAVALFREYAGTKRDGELTKMWAEKGALMIAKCAEALALRKAFPQDLSGLYTADEMSRVDSDNPPVVTRQVVPATTTADEAVQSAADLTEGPLTTTQGGDIARLIKRLGIEKAEYLALVSAHVGRAVKATADLTTGEAALVIASMTVLADEADAAEHVNTETGEVYEAELLPQDGAE